MAHGQIPERAAQARSARLATVGPTGPHVVPIVFAIVGNQLVTAVDHKPKSTRALKRLENIDHDPRVSVLIDHYDDDWSGLWWVRLDGIATVVEDDSAAIDALVAKYDQYREQRPGGPVIVVEIHNVQSWSAT